MKTAILSNLSSASLALICADLPPIWATCETDEAAEFDRYAAEVAEQMARLLPYAAEGSPLLVLCEDPAFAPKPAPSPGAAIYRARSGRTGSALLEARTAEAKEAEAIVVAELGKWINREIYAQGGDGGADCYLGAIPLDVKHSPEDSENRHLEVIERDLDDRTIYILACGPCAELKISGWATGAELRERGECVTYPADRNGPPRRKFRLHRSTLRPFARLVEISGETKRGERVQMPARLARAISGAGWHYCDTIPTATPSEPRAFALVFTRGQPARALLEGLPRYAPAAAELVARLDAFAGKGPAFAAYPSPWILASLSRRRIVTPADLQIF
jgi:hypothetical protein